MHEQNAQRIDFTVQLFSSFFFTRGNSSDHFSSQALSLVFFFFFFSLFFSFLSSSQIVGFLAFTRLSNSFAMKSPVYRTRDPSRQSSSPLKQPDNLSLSLSLSLTHAKISPSPPRFHTTFYARS